MSPIAPCHREGTTVCVISCDEARIVTMFRTDQRIEAACTKMLTAVQAISVSARPNDVDPDDCFYGGDLEGDGDANVSVTGYVDQGKATFTVFLNSGSTSGIPANQSRPRLPT